MKGWRRKAMFAAAVTAVMLVMGISVTAGWRPLIGPKTRALTNRTFARTAERQARGRYLVEAVAGCMDCHSAHDWTKHDAPILPGKYGAGQEMSTMLQGLPGRIVAPNLTPDAETGAGTWSDDAIARAIREGIGHDGRALFPMMPYQNFRSLPDEDVASIVVYLRTLQPVKNVLPKTEVAFPLNYLMRAFPQPVTAPVGEPDLSNPVKRGAFLVNAASCRDCHTPQVKGVPVAGRDLSGGQILEGAWGRVSSQNLTPDPSGIPYYDEERFVNTLRTGYVGARELKQIMPWETYRHMTDQDLRAIYAYLKTTNPVRHRVDNTEPPTYCPIDKTVHGGGNLNSSPAE